MGNDLNEMTSERLLEEVKRLRAAVRAHRDNSGHHLCWFHPQWWGLLPEPIAPQVAVPPWSQFMRGCIAFRTSLDEEFPDATIADAEFGKG